MMCTVVKLVMGAVSTFSVGRLPRRRLGTKGSRARRGCNLVRTTGLLFSGGCCLVVYTACVYRRVCSTVLGVKVCCVVCVLGGRGLCSMFS